MSVINKLIFPVILILLAYAFWVSSDIKQIAAGVAIFLFGILTLEDGFSRFSGGFLERFLHHSTNRLWKALNFGFIATSLMQSSSLVSVLVISFLSAGLIQLAAGIGIIFGANLGTTTGAWLVAGFGLKIDLSASAMPILVFGVIMILQKSPTWKAIGWILAGVGFLFLGIHYMKEGFDAFRESIDLSAYAVTGLRGMFLFITLGIVATVILQSSDAMLVLIITALAAQQITYDNALALTIGANLGTTVTAILASLGANISGKRLAGAHLIFNLFTGLIAVIFMREFLTAVEWFSNTLGIASNNYALRIAVFHSLFNLAGVLLMLPLVKVLVKLLERLMPAPKSYIKQPKFLNDAALGSSQAALEVVYKESERLYDLATRVIAHGLGWQKRDMLGAESLDVLIEKQQMPPSEDIDEAYETRIKHVYSAIVQFVIRAREKITGVEAENLEMYSHAGHDLVAAIKDIKHLQKNLLHFMHSENRVIHDAYNHLRILPAMVIRKIQQARKMDDPTEATLILDHTLLQIEESAISAANRIEPLIRDFNITPEMATSLMTDTEYTHNACRKLISTAKALFTGKDSSSLQLNQDLELNKEEMSHILNKNPQGS